MTQPNIHTLPTELTHRIFTFVEDHDLRALVLLNRHFGSIASPIYVLRLGIAISKPGHFIVIQGSSFRALGSWHWSRLFEKCVLMCHIDEEDLGIATAQLGCLRTFLSVPLQGVPISVISINGITLQPGELLQFIQLIDQAGCRRAVISTRNDDAYAFLLASELPLKPLTRLAAVRFLNLPNLVRTRFGTRVQGSGSAEYLNPNLLAGSGSSRG